MSKCRASSPKAGENRSSRANVMVEAVVVEGLVVVTVDGTVKVAGMVVLAVIVVGVGAIVGDGQDCWRT